MTVLVTGATGNVGSAVLRELLDRGVAVRAFVRDGAADLPAGVERAVGDFEDAGSIRAALDGVDRVFLASADGPRKVDHETAVIDAARDAELVVKWLVEHLHGAFALIRDGAFEEATDTVRVLTGREPRDFGEFARDHAAAFAPAVSLSG